MTIRTHGHDGIKIAPDYNDTMTMMGYGDETTHYNANAGRDFQVSIGEVARQLGTLATFLVVAANPELWVLAPLGFAARKAATARINSLKARPSL